MSNTRAIAHSWRQNSSNTMEACVRCGKVRPVCAATTDELCFGELGPRQVEDLLKSSTYRAALESLRDPYQNVVKVGQDDYGDWMDQVQADGALENARSQGAGGVG